MSKFYAVGVGDGSGSYLTMKAINVLENSGVIAVPAALAASGSSALGIVEKGADISGKEIIELIFPMTTAEGRITARCKAARRIIERLKNGSDVAMITIGDVSFYSTCSYVLDEIRNAGYETEIVAGVPSFCAAAARTGITFCEGDDTAAVITAKRLDLLEKYAADFRSIIIMKAGKRLGEIYKKLCALSLENNAFVCSDIGMETESVKPITEKRDGGYFTTVIVRR